MDSGSFEEFQFIRFNKYFFSIWGSLIGLSVLVPFFIEPWRPIGGMENQFINAILIVFVFVFLGFFLGYYLGERGGRIFYEKNFGIGDLFGASIIYCSILSIAILFVVWEVFYIIGYSTEAISPFNDPSLFRVLFYVFLYLIFSGSAIGILGGLIFGFLGRKYIITEE